MALYVRAEGSELGCGLATTGLYAGEIRRFMKRFVFKYLRLGALLILVLIITCAVCAYEFLVKHAAIPLTLETSQFCTNHVVTCVVDNAHPGLVAIGYNKKVYITALDFEKTGAVNVQIVNCMPKNVAIKCVAKARWDIVFSGSIYPMGSSMMSIWERESGEDDRSSGDDPDIELYDEKSGCLLCELHINVGSL